MEPVRGHNIHEPNKEASKIMAYFEEHKLFEIFRRMTAELTLKRPVDVKAFVRENIKSIANQVYTTRVCLLTAPIFDIKKLVKLFWKFYNIPIIVYTKKRQGCDGDVILEKFKKFLKVHKLERKNLIFSNEPIPLDFPDCRVECIQFHQARMDPTSIIEIIPAFQVPFKTRKQLEDEGSRYTWRIEQIKSYYREVFRTMKFGDHKIVTIGEGTNEWFAGTPLVDRYHATVEAICIDLVQMMRHTDVPLEQTALGSWLPRIVMLGRRGSGRKTQAMAVAKQFDLVYINFEKLIHDYLKSPCPFGDALRLGAKNHDYSDALITAIFYKRILQKDCLLNGWVVVGYPSDAQGFKNIEKLIIRPNKIFFIHCREGVVIRRLQKHVNKFFNKLPCNECDPKLCTKNVQIKRDMEKTFAGELRFFNLNKMPILQYLASHAEVIHIDGNHSVTTVKSKIWARLNQNQNGIGLTNNKKCFDLFNSDEKNR